MDNRVYTVHYSASLPKEAAGYIKEHSADIVIVPRHRDVGIIAQEISECASFGKDITVLSFLELLSGHSDTYPDERKYQCLLLMQYIEMWNASHHTDYPLGMCVELLDFLEEVALNGVSTSSLHAMAEDNLVEFKHVNAEFLLYLLEWWSKAVAEAGLPYYSGQRVDAYVEQWRMTEKKVVVVGIAYNRIFPRFLQTILQSMGDSTVILPYVDINLPDSKWSSLDQRHYQYYLMGLLRRLEISRSQLKRLGDCNDNVVINTLFNFGLHGIPNISCSSFSDCVGHVQLSVYDSEGDEAGQVVEILQRHDQNGGLVGAEAVSIGRSSGCAAIDDCQKKCAIFIGSDSLYQRVRSLISIANFRGYDPEHMSSVLLLSVLNAIITDGEASAVLSLLKHPLVKLTYPKEQYVAILCRFELEVIRKHSVTKFQMITDVLKQEGDEELTLFWQNVLQALIFLREMRESASISDIASSHRKCIDLLTGYSEGDSRFEFDGVWIAIENFFLVLEKYGKRDCTPSMRSYYGMCAFILQHGSAARVNKLFNVAMLQPEAVVLAGYNEGAYMSESYSTLLTHSMRSYLDVPSLEEYNGYLLNILHGLFCAKKLYITRSNRASVGISEEPMLIRYLSFLAAKFAGTYEKNVVEVCAENTEQGVGHIPAPNPDLETRRRKVGLLTVEAVAMLLSNPYAFYTRYVLGITPVRAVNTTCLAQNFNTVFRNVLHKYLACIGMGSNYDALIDMAKAELLKVSKHYPYVESMWWPRLEKMASHFYEADQARKSSVVTLEICRDFYWNICREVKVVAKCDTVVHKADDSVEAVRYKVSGVPTKTDMQCGISPRAIVESICVAAETGASNISFSYWHITPDGVEVTSVQEMHGVISEAKDGLRDFIAQYYEAETPFAHGAHCSKFKGYDLLSRVKGFSDTGSSYKRFG